MGFKNPEFQAYFKSVDKVFKKIFIKKLLAKAWQKYALFKYFFNGNSAFFYTLFDFFQKNFKVIVALFKNFEAKCAKTAQQIKKKELGYYVLDFHFESIQGPGFFIFKKKSNLLYPDVYRAC